MLSKLLKYDFRSAVKTWITLGVLSIVLSVVGGRSIAMSGSGYEHDGLFIAGGTIAIFVIVLTAMATAILSFYRFYQTLFTDEGYLTFTLPVTKQDLLLSKFIFSLASIAVGGFISSVSMVLMLLFSGTISVGESETPAVSADPMLLVYGLEALLIGLLAIVLGTLIVFVLVTLASRFSKKGRGVFAVAAIYGLGAIFSVFMTTFMSYVDSKALAWSDVIPEAQMDGVTALLLLCIIGLLALVCTALYTLEYYLLDKRLNLV
ncbi:MAG: ABC-2 transporter permease [Clostridia bacterium]|nr:ABC-2 transporter permease [Clostridia bacterium]